MSNEQNKIFIGNLSFRTEKDTLSQEFGSYGTVVDVSIPVDRETGRPRGFAFLTFETPEAAQQALSADGRELDGRNIKVSIAQSKGSFGGNRRNTGGNRY